MTKDIQHGSPLLKSGLHPEASDALRRAGFTAGDISQTVGFASASAGTHAPDGTVNGKEYAACTDFHAVGLSDVKVKALLTRIWDAGFAAWYRNPGHDGWPSEDARHIHAVYTGVVMKPIVQEQVHDFLRQPVLNGLASHAPYLFALNTHDQRALVRTLFSKHYHLNF